MLLSLFFDWIAEVIYLWHDWLICVIICKTHWEEIYCDLT